MSDLADPPTAAASGAPHLSLLGGFALACCDRTMALSPASQRLLACLALHRARPVPRAVLVDRLWGDTDPQHAASSLRSALWRLPRPHRRPLVVTGASTVALAEHVDVDLWSSHDRARALAGGGASTGAGPGSGGAEAPDDAVEVLGADLLPEWCDDWLLVEQESYRQLRLHALEALSANLRAIGRFPAALLAGLAAVRSEPLRETAHRQVIEVHLAEGNAAEALRQYQLYRRMLADELGLPPSPALRRLVAPLLGRPIDL